MVSVKSNRKDLKKDFGLGMIDLLDGVDVISRLMDLNGWKCHRKIYGCQILSTIARESNNSYSRKFSNSTFILELDKMIEIFAIAVWILLVSVLQI